MIGPEAVTRYIIENTRGYFGPSNSELILTFLQTGSSQSKRNLELVGLAPDQVKNHFSDEIFDYFRAALTLIERLDNQIERDALFINLRKQYPLVAEKILDEEAKQQVEQELKQAGPNRAEAILKVLQLDVGGQDYATKMLASILASQEKSNYQEPKKPSVLLFVGPSGIGKTELAKSAAKIKGNRYVYFEMEKYKGEDSSWALFGSPRGLVGSTDKPFFAEQMDKLQPQLTHTEGITQYQTVTNAIVLFNEIEKAHSEVKDLLMTLFDEGHTTVSYTKDRTNVTIKYTFKKCVFIATANLFQKDILDAFQRKIPDKDIEEEFIVLNQNPEQSIDANSRRQPFKNEFLARMKVVPFGPIPRGRDYQKIIANKVQTFFINALQSRGFKEVELRDETYVISIFAEKFYGDGTDLRKVEKYFQFTGLPLIDGKMANLGLPQTKKVIIYEASGAVYVQFQTFVSTNYVKEYVNIAEPIKLP